MSNIKRIGVLTSGGDAPGMNAAVRAVARTCIHHNVECLGIKRGYNGLISGDIMPLDNSNVSGIMRLGGTILFTARCDEFTTKEGQEKAKATCKYLGLDALIVIGGDGTFRGAQAVSELGVGAIGIPATIDNDIACSNYTIGFDSACNTAVECIDKLRDTMLSHERCSVVEVMGRHAGHLALYVAIACGATAVLVPEYDTDIDNSIIERIRRSRIGGRTHFVIIVAEGAACGAHALSEKINESLGIEPKVTILGHIQRGGAPTARDRVTASRLGQYAVNLALEGKLGRVVAMNSGELFDYDINEALSMTKGLRESLYDNMNVVSW
ncbi:MAG: 6-phosphofructokinase [Oscillospiraceae bacterium]|nr:6-phosphofructokinase [Oscillospiraceae bacterium]